MARSTVPSHLILIAAATAGLAVTIVQANAASETTRRNAATVQTYQNRQGQTPYYSGQTNPYYGANTQGMPPQPQNPANSSTLQNQLRNNERRSNGR